jgi:hypothetical protein
MNSHEQKSSTFPTEETSTHDGIVDQAKHALSSVAGQARQQVTHQMDVRKEHAVEKLGDVADAIRQTSDKLKDIGPLGDVAGRAADRIQQVATFFEGKQVTEIIRDVETFARREPAIFLGTAFALGLIGGRFLKSSPQPTSDSDSRFSSSERSASGPFGERESHLVSRGQDDLSKRYGVPKYASSDASSMRESSRTAPGMVPHSPPPMKSSARDGEPPAGTTTSPETEPRDGRIGRA